MPTLRPAATKSYLRDKWVFVPTGAYDPANPSLAILNATSALDVTKMFYASSAKPTQATNLVRAPRRIGDGETYEQVGETNPTLGEMRYSYNQQAASGSDQLKAYEKFPPGTTGYMVNRRGIDRDVDLALTQFVTSYPVECGPQQEADEGEGEAAESAIVQTFAQTGPKVMKKAIAA